MTHWASAQGARVNIFELPFSSPDTPGWTPGMRWAATDPRRVSLAFAADHRPLLVWWRARGGI